MPLKMVIRNVEFLLGEIEHLPFPNNTVDVIMSNCVVNLSTNKENVFNESFRVLKEGGRLAISDMVANKPLPQEMINNKELYCNCISGAITINELKNILAKAGFTDIVIEPQENSRMFIKDWVPGSMQKIMLYQQKLRLLNQRQDMITPKELFSLLSDETRLRCLVLLQKEGELCVCEISQIIGSIQPKMSRHLALMRNSGLVSDERRGQWVYYSLNPSLPDWAKRIIESTLENLRKKNLIVPI